LDVYPGAMSWFSWHDRSISVTFPLSAFQPNLKDNQR
jgi:hypothetical protein